MRYPDRERRRLAALRSRYPELEGPLAFLGRVIDSAGRFMGEPSDTVDGHQDDAAPPLAPQRFPLDEELAVRAFHTFLGALAETTPQGDGAGTWSDANGLDPRPLIRAYCAGDATAFEREAHRTELDAEALLNLAELAVKPQFVAAARKLEREASAPPERTDRCPICGSVPEMGLITDALSAERIMLAVCQLCETEWPVHRVRCLACGNEDDESLIYLQGEGEEEARLNVCKICNYYLPVLDVRGRLEFAPAVDRVALTHLDLMAQNRGFRHLRNTNEILARMGGGHRD